MTAAEAERSPVAMDPGLAAANAILRSWERGVVGPHGDTLRALDDLRKEYEELLAKYDALRFARPFTAGRPVFELPIK